MASQKKLSEIIIEHSDTIALLVTAIIAVILATLDIIHDKLISIVILLILCLLAFHHLRRSLKIEKMHDQIREIGETSRHIMDNTKICEEMGIIRIVKSRKDISAEEMHNEAKTANTVFIASRYFKAFAYDSVRDAFLTCLKNNGKVKIIIYSPKGCHLDVNIERDITSEEAKIRICRTIDYLRNFKDKLPAKLKEKFQYKIIAGTIIYTSIIGITGISNKIYATNYLNKLKGEDCPTIICRPIANNSTEDLYHNFLKEFDTLWEDGKSEDEIKANGSAEYLCGSFEKLPNNNMKN